MKKILIFLLPCLLLLASVAFASATIAKDDGIRGAPPGIAVQQDHEGSYAAPLPVAAQPSIETAFLPQSPIFVASANDTLSAADKGAITVVNDVVVATRSEVMPLVAKDFLTSNFASGKEIKLANAPLAIVAHIVPATIPMKEGMAPLAIKPIMSSSFVKSNNQFRAIGKMG